uniref:Uncharacterized protein n=1 Tax=Anguilla anguilla TaxID=7936 RepID=A0A0E9UDS2_ANGAN
MKHKVMLIYMKYWLYYYLVNFTRIIKRNSREKKEWEGVVGQRKYLAVA